jgi:hypothetical protein
MTEIIQVTYGGNRQHEISESIETITFAGRILIVKWKDGTHAYYNLESIAPKVIEENSD